MDRRDTDEQQLSKRSFDMDEGIDARNERRGWSRPRVKRAHRPMDTRQAITLAAVSEAALYMQRALKQAEQSDRQSHIATAQRTAAEANAQSQQQASRQAELTRLQQEKQYQSAEPKFWWSSTPINQQSDLNLRG